MILKGKKFVYLRKKKDPQGVSSRCPEMEHFDLPIQQKTTDAWELKIDFLIRDPRTTTIKYLIFQEQEFLKEKSEEKSPC